VAGKTLATIQRWDISKVAYWLPKMIDDLYNGKSFYAQRKENKELPCDAHIAMWLRRKPESLRKQIVKVIYDARLNAISHLEEKAMALALEDPIDETDAIIKTMQVKNLLAVASHIRPLRHRTGPDKFVFNETLGHTEAHNALVAPMTKDEAVEKLKSIMHARSYAI
jgi:hypothetical protein